MGISAEGSEFKAYLHIPSREKTAEMFSDEG